VSSTPQAFAEDAVEVLARGGEHERQGGDGVGGSRRAEKEIADGKGIPAAELLRELRATR
jgi:hypothetical protein